MRRVRIAALLLIAAPASCRDQPAETEKPSLYLITSLPLLFAEQFTLDAERPAVTAFLEARYRVEAVDLPSQLPEGATLLAVQPRALPSEELVALDSWVRRGGRLVLLADPMLEWPSERPLGDRLRPPMMFGDTGLLGHWGLQLDAPDKRGPVEVAQPPSRAGGRAVGLKVVAISPGRLVREAGDCSVVLNGRYAECDLGKGRAIIVADADWLNLAAVSAVGGDADVNLFALGSLLRAARD